MLLRRHDPGSVQRGVHWAPMPRQVEPERAGLMRNSVIQSVMLAETEGFEPSIELYNPITV